MVDVTAASPRRDDERGNARPIAVQVDVRRRYVVVEPTEVVPGEDHCGVPPVLASHQDIELSHRPVLTSADASRGGMVVDRSGRHEPDDRGKTLVPDMPGEPLGVDDLVPHGTEPEPSQHLDGPLMKTSAHEVL